MKLTMPITASVKGSLFLLVSIVFCVETRSADDRDLVITPNTIRIQSLEEPAQGQWVVMPGFSELGSPTFSRDGQWIAFDAYKEGFNDFGKTQPDPGDGLVSRELDAR